MSNPYSQLGNPDEIVGALAMPLDGHSQNEIIEALQEQSVRDVSPLSRDVLSIRASRRVLKDLESIARIEVKTPRSMHFR